MYKRILVAIDGSVTSQRGLTEAIHVAKDSGAKLLLVHVLNALILETEVASTAYYQALADALRNMGLNILQHAATAVRDSGVPFEQKLIDKIGAHAAEEIVAAAKDWNADLIVLGTHGRRGLKRLVMGSVSLSMLAMHGAAYAALKIDRSMATRVAAVGRVAAVVLIVALVAAGTWVSVGIDGQRIVSEINAAGPSNPLAKTVEVMRGGWLENYRAHGALWTVPALALVATLLTERLLKAGRFGIAFIASALTQATVILTAGIALFPFLMPSVTHPDHGLTIWDASSSAKTLAIMLAAVVVFLPIVLLYTGWVFRTLRGEVTLEHVRRQSGLY
jgi:nucleotide-binding universal stress UspA family protein